MTGVQTCALPILARFQLKFIKFWLQLNENKIEDDESFWELAESITSKDVQNIIIETLYELSIQDGLVAPGQKKLLEDLKAAWSIGD